jgi:hypothetical protein
MPVKPNLLWYRCCVKKETSQRDVSAFIRGQKPNGCFHSVCTTCFQSVSLKLTEKEVAEDEAAHVCIDAPLSRRYRDRNSY